MKYDLQLQEAIKLLPGCQNILIVLAKEAVIDELAAGLALFLAFEQSGKEASIVTEGVIRVGHTNLFGVGQIQNKLPQTSSGDFVLVLGGVATADGKVPGVEKMDYYPTGNDLNLVFRVIPGQKFNPTHITPRFEGGGFNLIFTIGSPTLDSLGSIYSSNPQIFANSHVVNIDNKSNNSQYGQTNIIDTVAASLSEIVAQILPALSLPFESDIATNILTGIFTATANLLGENVTADTYEAVSAAIRAGGKKPGIIEAVPQAVPDLSKIFNAPSANPADNFTVPNVVGDTQTVQTAAEEVPAGEAVTSSTPEVDWLTPKIYKGSSIG